MIQTRYGSEVNILFGDMDSGEALVQYREDGELLYCRLGQLVANGGLGEVEDAVIAARADMPRAYALIAEAWAKWLAWQPVAFRQSAEEAGVPATGADREILQSYVNWVAGLPVGHFTVQVRARCLHLMSISRSAIAAEQEVSHA